MPYGLRSLGHPSLDCAVDAADAEAEAAPRDRSGRCKECKSAARHKATCSRALETSLREYPSARLVALRAQVEAEIARRLREAEVLR